MGGYAIGTVRRRIPATSTDAKTFDVITHQELYDAYHRAGSIVMQNMGAQGASLRAYVSFENYSHFTRTDATIFNGMSVRDRLMLDINMQVIPYTYLDAENTELNEDMGCVVLYDQNIAGVLGIPEAEIRQVSQIMNVNGLAGNYFAKATTGVLLKNPQALCRVVHQDTTQSTQNKKEKEAQKKEAQKKEAQKKENEALKKEKEYLKKENEALKKENEALNEESEAMKNVADQRPDHGLVPPGGQS